MRNSETLQHRLGKALSACADNMVCLTATPVQTGLENLFRLLNILNESEFQNEDVFLAQCEANRPVIRAGLALRSIPPDLQTTVRELNRLQESEYTKPLTSTEFYESILDRCGSVHSLTRNDLVTLQRDVNELSLTGSIISRTRKIEVLQDRTVRTAKVISVNFNATEREFYDSVANLYSHIRPDLRGLGFVFAVQSAFRATASCIPAAAMRFREKLSSNHSIFAGLAVDFEDEHESPRSSAFAKIAESISSQIQRIESALEVLTNDDSKFDALVDALMKIWEDDGRNDRSRRKVVLFAYFKPTLAYLETRLQEFAIQSRLINGDIPIPERERLISEFASNSEVLVLLSSEVGSEGLDLQFASVIVNYDLPWNPMVVEQRIGRLDRIGQVSPRVIVLNLVAEGTIEKNILYRLYERIGVFEESIGDLEPILGDSIERLTLDLIRENLSDDEQRERVDQSANALHAERLSAEKLSRATDSLMATDQSFLDEIDGLIGNKKVPDNSELYSFVSEYLKTKYTGSKFPSSIVTRVSPMQTTKAVGDRLLEMFPNDSEALRFGRMLRTGRVAVTFNQDAALKDAKSELIHSRHPLVRLVCVEQDRNRLEMQRSYGLTLIADSSFGINADSPKELAFEIHLFEIKGVRPKVTFEAFFIDARDETLLPTSIAEKLMHAMLENSSALDPRPSLDPEMVDRISQDLRRW